MQVAVRPRSLLSAIALATFLFGLLAAVSTLGSWFTVGFGPVTGRISGWNGTSTSGDLGQESGDDVFNLDGEPTDSSDDVDWILGSLPDGVPVTFMGMFVAAIGLLLFLRARAPGALATPRRRGEVARLAGTAGVIAAGNTVWTVMSWRRFKGDLDDQLSESLSGDDLGFGAFFLAGIDIGPGWGLVTSAVTMGLAMLVAGLGVLLALKTGPATGMVAGGGAAAGPRADAPPLGSSWSTTPPSSGGPAAASAPPPAPSLWSSPGPPPSPSRPPSTPPPGSGGGAESQSPPGPPSTPPPWSDPPPGQGQPSWGDPTPRQGPPTGPPPSGPGAY